MGVKAMDAWGSKIIIEHGLSRNWDGVCGSECLVLFLAAMQVLSHPAPSWALKLHADRPRD